MRLHGRACQVSCENNIVKIVGGHNPQLGRLGSYGRGSKANIDKAARPHFERVAAGIRQAESSDVATRELQTAERQRRSAYIAQPEALRLTRVHGLRAKAQTQWFERSLNGTIWLVVGKAPNATGTDDLGVENSRLTALVSQ